MSESWLTPEEAIRTAYDYRFRGERSSAPVLLTDFDIKKLRVVEVHPGEWDDAATWHTAERPMTDAEFSALNAYLRNMRGKVAVGAPSLHPAQQSRFRRGGSIGRSARGPVHATLADGQADRCVGGPRRV